MSSKMEDTMKWALETDPDATIYDEPVEEIGLMMTTIEWSNGASQNIFYTPSTPSVGCSGCVGGWCEGCSPI